MAINVRLDVVLAERKMKLGELANEVGITLPNLSILKTGKAKAIKFSTLEAICRVLNCQPGDLLEYRVDIPGTGLAEWAGPSEPAAEGAAMGYQLDIPAQ